MQQEHPESELGTMPFDSGRLKQLITKALEPAKQNLSEYGKLLPVILIWSEDGGQKTIPVPDKFQVGKTIKREKPEAFVYVAEAWQREFSSEEKKLSFPELQKRVQEGRTLGASESPSRREIILLVGGAGAFRVSLEQRFHRDDGRVVFDGAPEMKDLKIGDSLVDWEDEGIGSESRLLTTAPLGGRIMHFDNPGFDIWIPEGWKMEWEPSAVDPNKTPVWSKDNNPHGGLRLRVETYKGPPEKPWDPLDRARLEVDRRRRDGTASNVQLDETGKRPLLTYRFLAKDPPMTRPWMISVFKVFDSKGAFVLMWMNQAEMEESEVAEELASTREIARRIIRE